MQEDNRKLGILSVAVRNGQETVQDPKPTNQANNKHVVSLPTYLPTKREDDNNNVVGFFMFSMLKPDISWQLCCCQVRLRAQILESATYRRVALVLTRCDAMHQNGLIDLAETNQVMVKRALKLLLRCGFLDIINRPARDVRTAPLLFFLRRERVTLPEHQLKFYALKPEARELFLSISSVLEDGLPAECLAALTDYRRALVEAHKRFETRRRTRCVKRGQTRIMCIDSNEGVDA